MKWTGLLVLLLLVPLAARAGFMDSLIDQAKQATESVIKQTVGDDTDTNPQSASPPASTQSQTHMTGEQKLAAAKEMIRGVWRATLHFHPEVLDDESWLKKTISMLYPQEAAKYNGNEFAWQKSKEELKARILKEIDNPPMTFHAAPWTNTKGGRVMLGDYDFKRQAFKIQTTDIAPPSSTGDTRPLAEKLHKIIVSQIGWLEVPTDKAEEFVNSGVFSAGRRLYADYDFTVIGGNKYEHNGRIGLVSKFQLGTIKLYAHVQKKAYVDSGAADYQYVGFLSLPDNLYQESKQTSKPQVQAKKSTPPETAPVKKAPPQVKKAAKPQPKADPLAGIGPYQRIEKGQPYGPDIVNLQLGMTLGEAEKLIRERKKPREVVTGKAPKPFVSAKAYPLEPGDESISVLTLDSPSGERIAGYVRYVYFSPDKHPSQVALASSLEKKYGKPSYSYEVPGNFERRWLTNALGEPGVGDQYGHVKGLDHCEGAASARSGAKVFSGKKKGYPYTWVLPWQQGGSPSGSLWYLKPGDGRIDQPNRCGSVLVARYDDGSSTVTGPTLTLTLFDTPWLVEEVSKQKAAEKAQGAKGLDL